MRDKKVCSLCGTLKSLADYGPRKGAYDGLRADCRECIRQRRQRQLEADPAQRERARELKREHARRVRADPVRYREELDRQNAWARDQRHNNPEYLEKTRQRNRDYHRRNPIRKPWWSNEQAKETRRGRVYGLRPGQYAQMLADQGGVCAICLAPPRDSTRYGELRVDHCHENNAVRSLLCHGCNTAIGNMQDDPERLEAAAAYIREHAGRLLREIASIPGRKGRPRGSTAAPADAAVDGAPACHPPVTIGSECGRKIREWGRAQGYGVADRGRIRADIIEAYFAELANDEAA